MSFLVLTGCPTSASDTEEEGSTTLDITKLNKNGVPVKNYLYIGTEDADPRVAMGYVMEDSGKPFFDYVIIFAATLRDRDCANDIPTNTQGGQEHINGSETHNCTKTGVHLHFDKTVELILENRDTYIKPLQDKGIKVLLGLLGDWSGVDFATFGEWPFEDVSPVVGPGHTGTTQGGQGAAPPSSWANGYPYTDAVRTQFLTEVRDTVNQYGLDGIDFDGEWSSSGPNEYEFVYPRTSGTLWKYGNQYNVWRYYGNDSAQVAAANARAGAQYAKTIIEAREILGPDKIITVYEWNYGRYIPQYVEWKGEEVRVSDYFDYSGEASYGTWAATSYIWTPHTKYAPVGIDIGGGDASRARPAASGTNDIRTRMRQHLAGNYGANLFYCLLSRARYNGMNAAPDGTLTPHEGNPTDSAGNPWRAMEGFFNMSASDPTNIGPEGYLSIISQELYGEKVVYVGDDYPVWTNLRYVP